MSGAARLARAWLCAVAAGGLLPSCVPDLSGAACTSDLNCPAQQHCSAASVCTPGPPDAAVLLAALSVQAPSTSLATDAGIKLLAIGTDSDGLEQDVSELATWSSSDPGVLTVSNGEGNRGAVRGMTPGTATVQAAVEDLTAEVSLTVTAPAVTSVSITPQNPMASGGASVAFTLTAAYSDGSAQVVTTSTTWTSSNTNVATVSNTAPDQGVASTFGVGTTTIGATFAGHSDETTLQVSF